MVNNVVLDFYKTTNLIHDREPKHKIEVTDYTLVNDNNLI